MQASERIPATVLRHPLSAAIAITIAWHLVLVLLDALLPPLSPDAWPELGASVINLTLFAVTLAVILVWRMPHRAGLGLGRPGLGWLGVIPLLAIAVSWAAPGIDGPVPALLGTAAMCLSIGLAEETLSRGLNLGLLLPLGAWRATVLCGVLFGLGHALTALWYERPLDDAAQQVVTTAVYGFCLAALRLHIATIWPLVVIHAAEDFFMLRSPGAAPDWWQIGAVAIELALGILLVRLRPRPVT